MSGLVRARGISWGHHRYGLLASVLVRGGSDHRLVCRPRAARLPGDGGPPGRAGVRDLLSRALRWRVGVRWYLFALFGLLAGVLVLAVPFFGLAPLQQLAAQWRPLLTVFLSGGLVPFVLINLPEELTWMGFLQDHLQERRGPLLASVLTAPAFTLVHLPGYFVDGWIIEQGATLAQLPEVLQTLAILAIFAVFFRALLLWLYNATGRSVLLVGLFHTVFNVVSGQQLTPRLIGDPTAANLLAIGATAVLAVVVTVATRGRLGYRPDPDAAS